MARMSASDRRDKLVEAAIVVMGRDGVANTTTRAIVAEAGMGVGVFHYCFRSKHELVLEVMRTISAHSFEAVSDVLTRTSDPGELIDLAVEAYWKHVEVDPLEHLLTYELTQYALREQQEHAAQGQYESYTTGMEEFLVEVARVGGITWGTPVDVLARYVLATIEGVTLQWIVTRDGEMARRVLGALVDQLRRDAGLPEQARESQRAVGG